MYKGQYGYFIIFANAFHTLKRKGPVLNITNTLRFDLLKEGNSVTRQLRRRRQLIMIGRWNKGREKVE